MTNPGTSALPIILVVEDEPLIRMYACAVVEDMGYVALEAADAAEALAILQGRSDIAGVFSDIGLPGAVNGIQLVNLIRVRWPQMPTLLTSGQYSPRAVTGVSSDSSVLRKPYIEYQLRDALTDLVSSP